MDSQQATKESFASNAAVLAKFRDLDQRGKIMAEYIWIDAEGMYNSILPKKNVTLTDSLSNLQATPAPSLAYVLSYRHPARDQTTTHLPSPAIGICAITSGRNWPKGNRN